MSLYDDCDVKTRTQENVVGWSSGIKLLQSQLQLKKAAVTLPKRDQIRKASLPPVIDLKSKSDLVTLVNKSKPEFVTLVNSSPLAINPSLESPQLPVILGNSYKSDYDWNLVDEYDPLWPNEYEKIVKELRSHRDRDRDGEKEDKRRNDRRKKSRFNDEEDDVTPQATLPSIGSGFAGRWSEDNEDDIREPAPKSSRSGGGAAIAPPPSLQEPVSKSPPSYQKKAALSNYGGGSVAAKIMARYGFKEGQGLGKQEQGMSIALQVEKTSKRGGRIIHEKEINSAPPVEPATPAHQSASTSAPSEELSITEIMKTPGKVVLLRNMVGPGEVDDDLEPEVKEECNTKYGDVGSVVIHEMPELVAEEAVRIFVEFSRIESAIKAVVDLNGRFFGGRQVKATFYDPEKFYSFQLTD